MGSFPFFQYSFMHFISLKQKGNRLKKFKKHWPLDKCNALQDSSTWDADQVKKECLFFSAKELCLYEVADCIYALSYTNNNGTLHLE
mmetsp:Transcript_28650/g.37551  ORF Transcript_28650/g.37551 Transcript_28650/m.37551 type:complete len:87 (-) Transcript_28650:21-281(-)